MTHHANEQPKLDLEALKKVAEAATGEHWFSEHHDEVCAILDGGAGAAVVIAQTNTMAELTDAAAKANAQHIATFDPPTVLALIARVQEGEEKPTCRNCGSQQTLAELYSSGFVGCCPERDMRPSTPKAGGEDEWRPEVRAFADLMEAQLRANDHKPGWKGESPWPLLERLFEEARELSEELQPGSPTDFHAWQCRLGSEAADVANFAMMIADVCGALNHPPGEAR